MPDESQIEGPKPVAVTISCDDVRILFAMGTKPDAFNQLILAKLLDAGAPVENHGRLQLAHGSVFKLKDSMLEPMTEFTYMWLPENYVWAMAHPERFDS